MLYFSQCRHERLLNIRALREVTKRFGHMLTTLLGFWAGEFTIPEKAALPPEVPAAEEGPSTSKAPSATEGPSTSKAGEGSDPPIDVGTESEQAYYSQADRSDEWQKPNRNSVSHTTRLRDMPSDTSLPGESATAKGKGRNDHGDKRPADEPSRRPAAAPHGTSGRPYRGPPIGHLLLPPHPPASYTTTRTGSSPMVTRRIALALRDYALCEKDGTPNAPAVKEWAALNFAAADSLPGAIALEPMYSHPDGPSMMRVFILFASGESLALYLIAKMTSLVDGWAGQELKFVDPAGPCHLLHCPVTVHGRRWTRTYFAATKVDAFTTCYWVTLDEAVSYAASKSSGGGQSAHHSVDFLGKLAQSLKRDAQHGGHQVHRDYYFRKQESGGLATTNLFSHGLICYDGELSSTLLIGIGFSPAKAHLVVNGTCQLAAWCEEIGSSSAHFDADIAWAHLPPPQTVQANVLGKAIAGNRDPLLVHNSDPKEGVVHGGLRFLAQACGEMMEQHLWQAVFHATLAAAGYAPQKPQRFSAMAIAMAGR
eukprot:2376029-Prymnesium_polylepis.2